MGLDPQLRAQFQQTVYVAAIGTSRTVRGEPTFGTPAARLCRFETRQDLVRNAQGEEVTSDYWMACGAAVGILDRVWAPGVSSSDATAALTPIAIEACIDENGAVEHYEVWL